MDAKPRPILGDLQVTGRLWRLRAVLLCGVFAASAGAAHALSEVQQNTMPEPPATEQPAPGGTEAPPSAVPLPGPVAPGAGGTSEPADQPPKADEPAHSPSKVEEPDDDAADEPLPEIQYDIDKLPEPVQRMRRLLIEACKSGDVEALRPLLQPGEDGTMLSFGELTEDPITFLKGLSGDEQGQEILAIMEEVLDAGYVHLGAGTPEELYVWPYFYAIPVDALDKRQRVELFKLLTAGEYEEMKTYGAYLFYRVAISPEGEWAYFVAGD